jgi:hypothetical protein
VWGEAAAWLAKFDLAVLTFMDVNGYPVSMRVETSGYDRATGVLTATVPDALAPVAGAANLMCHSHNEQLWNLKMMAIKGTLEQSDDAWAFRSEQFDPPSRLAVLQFVGNLRRSAQRYLDRRGLSRPQVNWDSVKEIQRRAKS